MVGSIAHPGHCCTSCNTGGKTVQRYLLTEAIEAFFEQSSLKASTLETYRFISRAVLRLLGHLHLDEIDRNTLREFVVIRKRTGVTDATIRRHLSFLGSVFTAAIRRGCMDTSCDPACNFNPEVRGTGVQLWV